MKSVRIEVLVDPMTIWNFKHGVDFEDWAFPEFFNQFFDVLDKLGYEKGSEERKILTLMNDNQLENFVEFDRSTLVFKGMKTDMLSYSVGVKFDAERALEFAKATGKG